MESILFKSADLDCLDLFRQKHFIDWSVNHIFFFFRKVSLFKQKLTSILLHFHLFHWEICRIFFYKIDSAFFFVWTTKLSINSGLLMLGSQAWGSVCHFRSVLHGFKSSLHIVLFIYHQGCRNKKQYDLSGTSLAWVLWLLFSPNFRKKVCRYREGPRILEWWVSHYCSASTISNPNRPVNLHPLF